MQNSQTFLLYKYVTWTLLNFLNMFMYGLSYIAPIVCITSEDQLWVWHTITEV